MFRYLPGIILVQLVTVALVWVNQAATAEQLLLRAALPATIIGVITALWLSTISRMESEKRHAKLIEKHAVEREKLNRLIERTRADVMEKANADRARLIEQTHGEKERLVAKTHKQLIQRERSISRRANIKLGLAFMAMTGIGVLMLMTELLTLGLLTITTAGGAMGGYLFRWRQGKQAMDRLSRAADEAMESSFTQDGRAIRVYESDARVVSDLKPFTLDASERKTKATGLSD